MKIFLILFTVVMATSSHAWAGYLKLAECFGHTESHDVARAVLFVDTEKDTQGLVMVSLESGWDYISTTKINWVTNPQGYPRFFENEFGLDIVINQNEETVDDITVDRKYISRLECNYTQKNL